MTNTLDILLKMLFFVTVAASVYKAYLLYTKKAEASNLRGKKLQSYKEHLESGLPLLSTIAIAAPFLGLTGTIVHIISALQGMKNAGMDMGIISGPIAQALNSTLWGLFSAIWATASHRFLSFRAQILLERAQLEDDNA